jgi:hypothetical protein
MKNHLWILPILMQIGISLKAQQLSFQSNAPIAHDTLKITEHKLGDLVISIKILAKEIKKPLSIKLSTDDHAAAVHGQDYQISLPRNGDTVLNMANQFSVSVNLTILANNFEEATEYFLLVCSFKNKESEEVKKVLTVEISKPAKTAETLKPGTKPETPVEDKAKRHTVFNDGIPCRNDTSLELTLTAIEQNKKVEKLEITWSAREKQDKRDTFNLTGNKTHFGNKASSLAEEINGGDCNSEGFRDSLDKAYDAAIKNIKAIGKKIAEDSEAARLASLRDSIEAIVTSAMDVVASENEDAAIIELKKDFIFLRKKEEKCNCGAQVQSSDTKSLAGGDKKVMIDSVVFKVFNNTIHQLDIVGTVDDEKIQTISNNQWGIPLRHFIDNAKQRIFYSIDGDTFYLCFCELFLIRPTKDGAINYTIKDGDYTVFPINTTDKPTRVPIAQKRLLDYFSVSAFFDFLSLDENNPNKTLFTEAYFRFNISNWNKRGWYGFKQTYTTINIAANLFGNGTLGMKSVFDTSQAGTPTATKTTYYVNNLDLYRYAFFQGRPMLNIFGRDIKSMNLYWEMLNTGVHFLGSNAQTINRSRGNDSMQNRTVYSVSPVFETRFRVTPKSNFGVDFHLSYLPGFKPLTADFTTLSGKEPVEYLFAQEKRVFNKRDLMIAEMNFFFNPKKDKSATDRGGFYFRMNLAKPTNFGMGHFMFLAGYSSDIKTFMR